MAAGLSIKLPLNQDFELNKTIRSMVRQNLKMVLLTSPGERVAIPDFGVGLRRFLFEPLTQNTLQTIRERIKAQASKYLPGVRIDNVYIKTSLDNPELIRYGDNYINISINYTVVPIGKNENFNLDVTDAGISIT